MKSLNTAFSFAPTSILSLTICPSAQEEIDVPDLLETIIDEDVYRSDYNEITTYFQNQPVEYEKAITVLKSIINSGMFSK